MLTETAGLQCRGGDPAEFILDARCKQTGDVSQEFNLNNANIRLIVGQYTAYKAIISQLEPYLTTLAGVSRAAAH